MKKRIALLVSMLLIISLLSACGEKPSSVSEPAQSSSEPASVPEASAPAENEPSTDAAAEPEVETEPEEIEPAQDEAEPVEEETPAAPTVTLEFDPHLYQDTNNDDSFHVLTYASNSGDKPVQAVFKYTAFDQEGNAISAFNMRTGGRSEVFKDSVYIPAGVENFPVAFTLPQSLVIDMSTGEEMPEIDHIDFELLEILEEETEDLREHFTPGEPEIRESHLYLFVKFDQEIADHCQSLFMSYTLLGYSNGVLTTVCCASGYPYSTSSYSVSYAKENNDNALLIYHRVPKEPVDKWELYLGCISGE